KTSQSTQLYSTFLPQTEFNETAFNPSTSYNTYPNYYYSYVSYVFPDDKRSISSVSEKEMNEIKTEKVDSTSKKREEKADSSKTQLTATSNELVESVLNDLDQET